MSEPASERPAGSAQALTAESRQAAKRGPWPGLARLARWLLGLFYRSVEVAGRERVPQQGPTIYVANHVNGLVDPGLLLGYLPGGPRFLAKSTLWRNPMVRPFLNLGAAIPVYRRHDPGVDPARNAETFARCHEVLAQGGSIALFPEGRSHNEPSLMPLKTGVSRIVLEAEQRFGGLGTRIVPVGLLFDDKGRFRSRVLVQVGEPLVVGAEELEAHMLEPREAVRQLTERVATALAAVTLNYPSWEEARLLERALSIHERPSPELPAEPSLADRFAIRHLFLTGYRELRSAHPDKMHSVAETVRDYDELLALYRLRDAQVAASYPTSGILRFLAKSAWLLGVSLPLAILGSLVCTVPYIAVHLIAGRWGKTPDQLATYKVFASLVFYPIAWLLASGLAWTWLGGSWAVAVLASALPASYAALRFHQRWDHFGRQVRAFLLLRSRRKATKELRYRRQLVLDGVRELVSLYQAIELGRADAADSAGGRTLEGRGLG